MLNIPFQKMNGQGNDYLFIYQKDIENIKDIPALSIAMSDRHFGVGSDGIVILSETGKDAVRMQIFNADGSEAEMCGTALRCTVALIAGLTGDNEIRVETRSGLKSGHINKNQVVVNMGSATFLNENELFVASDNKIFSGYYVSMGNPHFVCFDPVADDDQLKRWGTLIENHSFFPNRTNVEFVEIISETEIKVKVWERGSGITLACGTGACASMYVCHHLKKTSDSIKVNLPGGQVTVFLDNNNELSLMGPVNLVFKGNYFYNEV